MPFVPHTDADIGHMLDAIGAPSIDSLFDEIPSDLRCGQLKAIPPGLSEMEIGRLMAERAAQDGRLINFCGAGAYEHHIPAAVWEIATRGEFYSAYTPYQAEASQGTLQLLYEFQTMMAELSGMEVSNASLYDGATALAEALLMAARVQSDKASQEVWLPQALHPYYAEVVASCTAAQGLKVKRLPYDPATGRSLLPPQAPDAPIAVVIAQPNFFGVLEDVDALTDWAHAQNALVIGLVNPTSLALLKPPGQWGGSTGRGADIVCGEGQPLGSPLASGGPYFGFLTARLSLVRQMPGRIVGQTVDLDGRRGFALTLQAREQHIRRAKATSNICTNQGLLVTAATIYLSLIGAQGLAKVASACLHNTRELVAALGAVPGVQVAFNDSARFHEAVIMLPRPVAPVLDALARAGVFGGFDLSRHFPELGHALLVCATETRTESDIRLYADTLSRILAA